MKTNKLIGVAIAAAGLGAIGMAASLAQPDSEHVANKIGEAYVNELQPETDHPGKRYVEEFRSNSMGPEVMAAYMKAGEPGVAHELIAMMEGDFKATNRMWMNPDAEPMESTASSSNTMIMGGRFLETSYAGDIMGMPFTGKGLMGYDNNRKLFTSLWIDSMSTGISTSMGNLDESGTTITLIGEMDEPTTGEMGKAYKTVFRITDENTHSMEMWEILYGEPFKVMEITYERIEG